jgi:hypothetical protein
MEDESGFRKMLKTGKTYTVSNLQLSGAPAIHIDLS